MKESPNASTATDFYYTASWQIAEEQQSGTTKVQNVWGLSYIDDLVIRDKDADGSSGTGSVGKSSSGLEQRLYAQQDANHRLTCGGHTPAARRIAIQGLRTREKES